MYLAWEKRVTRLELEVDLEIVVGFLKTRISDAHPLSFLVCLCHGFISRDWTVRIFYVYREANRLAGLTTYVFSLNLSFHLLDVVPSCVGLILSDDTRGTTIPWRVCV